MPFQLPKTENNVPEGHAEQHPEDHDGSSRISTNRGHKRDQEHQKCDPSDGHVKATRLGPCEIIRCAGHSLDTTDTSLWIHAELQQVDEARPNSCLALHAIRHRGHGLTELFERLYVPSTELDPRDVVQLPPLHEVDPYAVTSDVVEVEALGADAQHLAEREPVVLAGLEVHANELGASINNAQEVRSRGIGRAREFSKRLAQTCDATRQVVLPPHRFDLRHQIEPEEDHIVEVRAVDQFVQNNPVVENCDHKSRRLIVILILPANHHRASILLGQCQTVNDLAARLAHAHSLAGLPTAPLFLNIRGNLLEVVSGQAECPTLRPPGDTP